MKKNLILIAILFLGNSLMAQNTKFGITTGINFPSLQSGVFYSPGGEDQLSAKFLLGLFAETSLGTKNKLQIGLNFSTKGNKATQDANTISFGTPIPYTIERNVNISYLELPITLLYNKTIKIGSLYGGGGLYGAYAIAGRVRSIDKRNTYYKKSNVETVEFGNQSDQLKSGDFGANLMGGLRLKNGMDFGLKYGLGIANISNDPAFKSHNSLFGLQVGYLF